MANIRISKIKKGKGSGGAIDPRRLMGEMDLELQELATMIKEYMLVTAQGSGHKFKGEGLASSQVTFDTDGVVIKLPAHAVFVDQGRKPGKMQMPPVLAIIQWIKKYRIGGRSKKTGRFQKVNNVNSLAWAIATNIKKFGIRPRPFIAKTLEFAESLLAQAIDEILIPQIVSTIDFHFDGKKVESKK